MAGTAVRRWTPAWLATLATLAVLSTAGTAQAAAPAWTEIASGTTDGISAIEYQADDRFWFTTTNGKIFRRTGTTFTQVLDQGGVVFNDIEFQRGGQVGLAVGNNGAVWRSGDGGATWVDANPSSNRIPASNPACNADAQLGDVQKVAFARDNIAYLFGDEKQISRSEGTAANVGEPGRWTDANRTGSGCRVDDEAITGAFFPATGANVTGYLQSMRFGSLYFTADNLAGTPQRKNSQLNGFETPHRITGDPGNPGRQWGISVDEGGNPSYFKRTENGWTTPLDWEEGNPNRRERSSMFDIAFGGGTVLAAGSAGQIMNSIDGRTFFYVDAAGLPTQDWRAVGVATANKAAVGGINGKLVVTDQANQVPDVVAPTGTIGGPSSGTAGQPLTFSAVVADNAGGSGVDPAGFSWTVTGLPPQSGPSATYTFPAEGTYEVRLGFRDREGNAASATRTVTIAQATPTLLPVPGLGVPSATFRRKGARVSIRVRGKIKLPVGTSAAEGCRGNVVLTLRRGKRRVAARTAKLSTRCGYVKTIVVKRRALRRTKTLRLTVRFTGNSSLRGASRTFKKRVRIRR